ncbi:hypothetical protein LSH36_979g02080 [Paralvinella palmiformis]|uniref:small monomeric GTPase n=1 Tax=Paralvinella palmiformis TaxID=53620 RepID=A0AAD9MTC7_9ANNE|nr:hypothetical protein LSH36_979g02080 [Paralvinella palmiformis]
MRLLTPPRGMKSSGKTSGDACKLVMLGSAGVGKSALVVRYLTKRFIWEYDPTLEYAYRHQTQVDEELANLEILDTAGLDDSPCYESHLKWGDGFMIVYSVNDRRSFDEVKVIKRTLDEIRKSRNVSCVIVGNKSDLDHDRRVTTAEGEGLAAEHACAFFETSACDGGAEIQEAFHELYREVRRRKILENKSRRRSSAAQVKNVLGKMFTKINSG